MGSNEEHRDYRILKAYLSCRDALVRSVLKMCVRQQDVDDILHETYLRVLNANKKTAIKSPQDYLFVVSRNLVIKKLSRRSREISMEINDALVGAEESSTDRTLHYQQKFEILNDALGKLPEKKRRAILLRKFYGLSHTEIAGKMNVSVSSVEKYISSGLKQCKQLLISHGYHFDNHTEGQQSIQHQETGNRAGKE